MRTIPEWKGKTDDTRPHIHVRNRIFEKQSGKCALCGLDLTHRRKHLDHIVRLRDGGENREFNLQMLCLGCHQNKTTDENIQGAKALRIRDRHRGLSEPSQLAKRYAAVKEKYDFDWKTHRWVPKTCPAQDREER